MTYGSVISYTIISIQLLGIYYEKWNTDVELIVNLTKLDIVLLKPKPIAHEENNSIATTVNLKAGEDKSV